MSRLQFQVGLHQGAAVGYCPQTGHLSTVSLAGTARRLQRAGRLQVPPDQVGALYEALEQLDDRPAVGAGKVAKKLKKVVKKVASVAKKIANSKLGQIVMTAASVVAGPFGGAALGALKTGVSLAKSAAKKRKAKTPAAAKKQIEAKRAAPIAAKLAKKKITPKQATQQAKKAGVKPAKVKAAAFSLRVSFAAKAGNPKAQALLKTAQMVEEAKQQPEPLDVGPEYDEGPSPTSTNPDTFGEPFEAESYDESQFPPEPAFEPESFDDGGAYDDGGGEYDDGGGDADEQQDEQDELPEYDEHELTPEEL